MDFLRFRMWDDINNEMIYLEDQDVSPYNMTQNKQNNIMQCIGFKDKAHKLIYQSDIVKYGGMFYKVIRFWSGEFKLQNLQTEHCLSLLVLDKIDNVFTDLEIVGNTYQTKELKIKVGYGK